MSAHTVLNIAHRGDSGNCPQNTLAAFASAVEIGVDGVEFDVRSSADGELFVIHDATVDATTDGSGPVREMTANQVRGLGAGAWFDARFAGERVPGVEQVLDLLPSSIGINMHLKCCSETDPGFDARIAALFIERDLRGRAVATCDYVSTVLALGAADDAIACRTTIPPETDRAGYLARTLDLGLSSIQPNHGWVDEAFVRLAHRLGLRVDVFYADEPEAMRYQIACGVDAILTNHPARLKQVLAEGPGPEAREG